MCFSEKLLKEDFVVWKDKWKEVRASKKVWFAF